jgi:hypothetical protein
MHRVDEMHLWKSLDSSAIALQIELNPSPKLSRRCPVIKIMGESFHFFISSGSIPGLSGRRDLTFSAARNKASIPGKSQEEFPLMAPMGNMPYPTWNVMPVVPGHQQIPETKISTSAEFGLRNEKFKMRARKTKT